jgi:hypothetical protein
MQYIEDVLHYLVDNIGIDNSDKVILTSISRQCKKGIGLTDKQCNLVSEKINSYVDVLNQHNIFIENITDTKIPLRSIDRSKTIKIVDLVENFSHIDSHKTQWKWIELRFPFAKKYIALVDAIGAKVKSQYFHKKGSHTHYFKLTEKNVDLVVENFIHKGFIIDDVLLATYNEIQAIKSAGENSIIPYYDNEQFYNLTNSAIDYLQNKKFTLKQIHDRKLRYGLCTVSPAIDLTGLDQIVVNRESSVVHVDPERYTVENIFSLLNELDRYPLLVCLDETEAFDQIQKVYFSLNNFVSNEEQAVLFRVDSNSTQARFNSFVADNNLNNWVNKDTKVVYIEKNKIPKVLLKEEWKPICAVSLNSNRFTTMVNDYVVDNVDLLVYYDKEKYSVRNLSRYASY